MISDFSNDKICLMHTNIKITGNLNFIWRWRRKWCLAMKPNTSHSYPACDFILSGRRQELGSERGWNAAMRLVWSSQKLAAGAHSHSVVPIFSSYFKKSVLQKAGDLHLFNAEAEERIVSEKTWEGASSCRTQPLSEEPASLWTAQRAHQRSGPLDGSR